MQHNKQAAPPSTQLPGYPGAAASYLHASSLHLT